MADVETALTIPNIEKELSSYALPGEPASPACGPKACLFTLILFANEERRGNYLQELVSTILDKFPCRIIFIQGDKGGKGSHFNVSVSHVISGQSSGATAICDQIVISCSDDQLKRVPFIVIPHIVPDLPIYLLWAQNPFEEREIFPYLQPYASRLIFDSECAEDLRYFCKDMQQSLASLKLEIMDISWALISNWRDLLLQIFDTPERVKQLDYLKTIIFYYNGNKAEAMKHPETRPLYLQAWLASCLNWKFRGMESMHGDVAISYIGPIHPVVVGLSPQYYADMPPGTISSIDMKMSNGMTFSIARKPAVSQVVVHVATDEQCELPFTLPLPSIHTGLAFMREIFFGKLGDKYHDMLKFIPSINCELFACQDLNLKD